MANDDDNVVDFNKFKESVGKQSKNDVVFMSLAQFESVSNLLTEIEKGWTMSRHANRFLLVVIINIIILYLVAL